MKKFVFSAMVTTIALGGCTKLPAIGAKAPERETVVKMNRAAKQATQDQAEMGTTDPTRVDHATAGSVSLINHGTAARPMEATEATDAEIPAIPGQPATIAIETAPQLNFKAIPVFEAEDQVTKVKFSPSDTSAVWSLQTTGAPQVSKVTFDIADETNEKPEQFDLTTDELKLPAKLAPTQKLEFSPTANGVLAFLKHHPKAKTLTLGGTLKDMDGQPLGSKDGQPLKLELTLKVL